MPRTAIIDLGTNTFHLFIVSMEEEVLQTLYKEKIAVKIGQNGISNGKIASDAYKRALHTLGIFKTVIDQFEVTDIRGVATSAIRNASNGRRLLDEINSKYDIDIEIISGQREAELIYHGVKAAMTLPESPQLIMDIGGGSVEFIIGNNDKVLWAKSFEIGAQRLLDKFHQVDPIEPSSISQMSDWLEIELEELIIAISDLKPVGFIGCSGTFDTLKEIYRHEENLPVDIKLRSYEIPVRAYRAIHEELINKNRAGRLEIPGMVSMRVDMIVVASCLIHFVLDKTKVNTLNACSYALKEGVLFHDRQGTSITD